MELRAIFDGVKIRELYGKYDIEIENICYDSRKVKENSLFICIDGFNVDGNKFIKDAIEKGARVIVSEKNIVSNYYKFKATTFIRVDDIRGAMSKISSNFYKNPTKDINIIGVTGTNGKTTITTILRDILNNIVKTSSIGTIEIYDGNKIIESTHTTPESLNLQSLFKDIKDNNCEFCAMEVSSHSLKLKRVEDVDFNIGIFTNLTRDHLDFHKDIDDYKNAKKELFFKTKCANIINIDDEYGYEIYNEIKNLDTKVYSYGIYEECDIKATEIKLNLSSVEYKVTTPTYEDYIKVNIPGEFTVYNTLSIIACLYELKISKEDIKKYLESIKGVPGRFEQVDNNYNKTIIVDYAHTPDALENILKTANEFKENDIITVFGCGGDRDKSKRPLMGEIACKYSNKVIVTSDNPRNENSKNIIDDILCGCEMNKVIVIEDRKEAIKKSIDISKEKDIIIIAGKGHETYQIIGDKIYDFDDKKVIREILHNKKEIKE